MWDLIIFCCMVMICIGCVYSVWICCLFKLVFVVQVVVVLILVVCGGGGDDVLILFSGKLDVNGLQQQGNINIGNINVQVLVVDVLVFLVELLDYIKFVNYKLWFCLSVDLNSFLGCVDVEIKVIKQIGVVMLVVCDLKFDVLCLMFMFILGGGVLCVLVLIL